MNSRFNRLVDTNKTATFYDKVLALYEDQKERSQRLSSKVSFEMRLKLETDLQRSENTIARMEIRHISAR